jgi:hypothetical protein
MVDEPSKVVGSLADTEPTHAPIPAFPAEYAAAAQLWMFDAIDSLTKDQHPLLAQFRYETITELPSAGEGGKTYTDSEGVPNLRIFGAGASYVMPLESILAFDVGAQLAAMDSMADEFGGEQVRQILGLLSETTEAVGNVISGPDLIENMIAAMEKLPPAFDENGTPQNFLVMSPEMADQLRQATPTPEQEARIAEIQRRKYEQWQASRTRKPLP